MAAQDDARELQMRQLFNLTKTGGRSDIDATLTLRGRGVPKSLQNTVVPFELKSATGGVPDISTVRDFGLHYIEKWSKLHWLFGVYGRDAHGDQTLVYCLYGSPQSMKPWFDRMASYIAPDVALTVHVPDLITDDTMSAILGSQRSFSRDDVKRLLKRQKDADGAFMYKAPSDLAGDRFSRKAMLRLLRVRAEYVIKRGSTLNNPHIPASYFAGWPQITDDHAATLREMVLEALDG